MTMSMAYGWMVALNMWGKAFTTRSNTEYRD